MIAIIGVVVVFGAVLAGYLIEHGNMSVLLQPAELIIIGGAAIGTVIIANPIHILTKIAGGITAVLTGSPFTKERYLNSLKMMYELFSRARRDGMMALETDSDNPEQSPIFSKYPAFLKDHHVRDFVCDSIRMASSGSIEPFDADQMIETDMEVHHHEATQPIAALSAMADSLPGLGIVAAVLGVVITMGALGGPPEEIGKHVAAALVGTFLGILMCYGLVGPIFSNMAQIADDEHAYYQVLRVLIVVIIKKKAGHGGHHGGAWKVAYADFVTAMMALFIVLWLLNSSKKIQDAVGGYFRDPQGTAEKAGKSIVGSNATTIAPPTQNMDQLKQQLQKAIEGIPNFDKLKNHIEMTITPEGLRIELTESAAGTFFDSGSPKLSSDGQDILIALAGELGKLPNKLSVEGHTDAKPYAPNSNYGNWELSADRANAARRLLQTNGVAGNQITQVRGFADQQLRKPDAPLDPSNRRISLIVHYLDTDTSLGQPSARDSIPSLPGTSTAVPARK